MQGSRLTSAQIKSNLGHCEPASGVAGIMKSVLALEHGWIPPIRQLEKLNPNGRFYPSLNCYFSSYSPVDLKDGRLQIVQKATQWPEGSVRRASVNSFGYGGANAHTILETIDQLAPGCGGVKAKSSKQTLTNGHTNGTAHSHTNGLTNGHSNGLTNGEVTQKDGQDRLYILPFSAHNEKTLKANVTAIRDHVNDYDLHDLSYTLGCRRTNLMTRTFAIANASNVGDALDLSKMPMQKAMASQNPVVGFVFTGMDRRFQSHTMRL